LAAAKSLAARIASAESRANADGRQVHHVSLCAADWAQLRLPPVTFKPALKASASVVWAIDAKGWKLTPYPVSGA
jgi:hypothetical protein